MAISSFNNLNENMASLRDHFIRMYSDIALIEEYYAGMRKEALDSLEDSQKYWEDKFHEEQSKVAAASGEQTAQIDAMVQGLISLDMQLCKVDKSYAKRKELYLNNVDVRKYTNDSLSLYDRFNQVHSEMIKLANECSSSVKAVPLQELELLVSNRRKEKYEKLCFLLEEAKIIRSKLLEQIKTENTNHTQNWAEKRNAEIDLATEETAELLEIIKEKETSDICDVLRKANSQLENVLSIRDIGLIIQMSELLGDKNELPEECCEHVLLGNLILDLSNIMQCPEAESFINNYYGEHVHSNELVLPAIYDMSEGVDICFEGHGNTEITQKAIHSVMYSLLKNQPASRQIFYLSDPEGRAKGFGPYLDFLKTYPDIMGARILTSKDMIRGAINFLSEYVDEVGQSKFVGYKNIFEYNSYVQDKQEPLKCICLLAFPKYFDEDMLDSLYNVMKNGKEFGIQVLIELDETALQEKQQERTLDLLAKILSECIDIEYLFGKWIYKNKISLEFARIPAYEELVRFNERFSIQYKLIKDTSLPIRKIISLHMCQEGNSSKRIEIPIGKDEFGKEQNLILGEGTSHHALIIGSLGSGKSTLLHTIIMSAITKYSPDEINLYLMDFKSGTEFKIYAEKEIPHIKLLALDAMQEFGQSILDYLWEEMQARSRTFNELIKQGLNVKGISSYRRLSGKKMPRILVIADEFQMLFSEEHNRSIANYCGGKFADFISLSRVYGIHFIFATQTIGRLNAGFSIRRSTINEMYVRIGLKCTENECNLLFGDKNGRNAFGKMGGDRGSAVYCGDYVQGTPVGFKVAYCDEDTQEELLTEVEQKYSLMEPNQKTIVFVGDSVPQLLECKEFCDAYPENTSSIYLGTPIKIDEPVCIKADKTRRRNLLLVGSNQEMTDQLVSVYMLNVLKSAFSLGLQLKHSVFLLDGLTVLGEQKTDNINQVYVNFASGIRLAVDNFDIVTIVDELYTLYEQRREKRMNGVLENEYPIHVIINNVQWLEVINLIFVNKNISEFTLGPEKRKGNNDLFGYLDSTSATLSMMDNFLDEMKSSTSRPKSNVSYTKKLLTMIETGYTYGMHFVMSSPDLLSIKEYLYDVIPKFTQRIVYSLSNNDADRIISEAKTELLRSNIVIYYDGIKPAYQMKPFAGITDYLREIN